MGHCPNTVCLSGTLHEFSTLSKLKRKQFLLSIFKGFLCASAIVGNNGISLFFLLAINAYKEFKPTDVFVMVRSYRCTAVGKTL